MTYQPSCYMIMVDIIFQRSPADKPVYRFMEKECAKGTSYHRHDISDKAWALLEPHLPGQRGQWGGIAQDNRRFILFLDKII